MKLKFLKRDPTLKKIFRCSTLHQMKNILGKNSIGTAVLCQKYFRVKIQEVVSQIKLKLSNKVESVAHLTHIAEQSNQAGNYKLVSEISWNNFLVRI